GVVVDDGGVTVRAERTGRGLRLGVGVDDVVERELHRLRVERGAVVELDVLAQVERVARGVGRRFPARREARIKRRRAVTGKVPGQMVEYAATDRADGDQTAGGRIKGVRLLEDGHGQGRIGVGRRRAASAARFDEPGQRAAAYRETSDRPRQLHESAQREM